MNELNHTAVRSIVCR